VAERLAISAPRVRQLESRGLRSLRDKMGALSDLMEGLK